MLRISLIGRVAVHVTARATCRAQTLRGGKYAHRDLVAHRNHAWTADGFATARGVESLGSSNAPNVPRGRLSGLRARLPRRQPRCEVGPDGAAHTGISLSAKLPRALFIGQVA